MPACLDKRTRFTSNLGKAGTRWQARKEAEEEDEVTFRSTYLSNVDMARRTIQEAPAGGRRHAKSQEQDTSRGRQERRNVVA